MIDRYDAPEGYVAVREQVRDTCSGCSFGRRGSRMCYFSGIKCLDELREDKTDVIFKTRDEFEKMLLQEIEQFYGKGKVKKIVFTEE